ncbi:MAG: hypothetical protein NC818_02715 [Candidatus Omnitrophica bacterium]|nr:hypothetical protein [Candidatus Omnitrophota bacterium]
MKETIKILVLLLEVFLFTVRCWALVELNSNSQETNISAVIAPYSAPLTIIGAQDKDSQGSKEWRIYLDVSKFIELWSQEEYLPFGKYQQLKLLTTLELYKDRISPRYSQGEINAVEAFRKILKDGYIDRQTMVIVDMGGAHSVAVAMELVKQLRFRPIILADVEPLWPMGSNVHAIQELATLLYFSAEFAKIKPTLTQDAPPVFILDLHRGDRPSMHRSLDNTYVIEPEELPTVEELWANDVHKVVIIREGMGTKSNAGYLDNVDFGQRIKDYAVNEIEVKFFEINPWPDLDIILEEIRRLNVSP